MPTHRLTLPVVPLDGIVIFPGTQSSISIGQASALRAIEHALKHERQVFAVTKRPDTEGGTYGMGTIVRIAEVHRGLNGANVTFQAESRGTLLHLKPENEEGFSMATVVVPVETAMPADDPTSAALEAEARERIGELGRRRGIPEVVLQQIAHEWQDLGQFADVMSAWLDISTSQSQALLETMDVGVRLRQVLVHVQRQLTLLDAREQIQSQVQEEMGERQREFFLREQLKAIRKELGEGGDGAESDDLRARLESLPLSVLARKEVTREIAKLERAGRDSAEAQVIRTYLEWIVDLPWGVRSEDNLDLRNATKVLDDDHYGLQDVKDRILEFLAVRQLRARMVARDVEINGGVAAAVIKGAEEPRGDAPTITPEIIHSPVEAASRTLARGSILLFVGPPGVGKTSIAKSIARALDREYVRVSLGGVRDEADIRGHRKTYVGAMPGRILQGLKQAKTKNPVFLLDEVDKLGHGNQGDPSSALLEVLDPAQNDTFTDHYLNMPFDLSEVLFVATANTLDTIPAPLRDRMEVIEFTGYTEREKVAIAERYLLPRQLEESGLARHGVTVGREALEHVVNEYTREAGVRQLEQKIGTVVRKLARRQASGEAVPGVVTSGDVLKLLGRPTVHPEHIPLEDQIGVSTGMYYTPVGGDIMFVEASVRSIESHKEREPNGVDEVQGGAMSLILTGQLGEVMRESARAAATYATAHARDLGIPASRLGAMEAHIHVPQGAVPKDGPSAGLAIATALVSELSGRAVRRDVAMTGEITLRGRALPIGGLKEKVLGAHRAGVRSIILPRANEADIEDIPEEVRKALTFYPVDTLVDVLAVALVPGTTVLGG